MRIFGILLFLFLAPKLMAIDIATIDDRRGLALGPLLDIWDNRAEPAREADVLEGKLTEHFHRSQVSYPSTGFSHGEFWARFTLTNTGSEAVTLWLESRYSLTDHVALFTPDAEGQYEVRHQGDKVDFKTRELFYRMPAFAVTVHPGTHIYYIRTTTAGSNMLSIFLWKSKGFDRHRWLDNGLVSGMLGILVAMLCYNSFLALSLRSHTYYYYSIFLLLMIAMQFCMLGFPILCVDYYPGSWLMNEGFLYSANLTGIAAILVTTSFLNMKEFMPRWHIFCRLLLLIPICIMISGFYLSYNAFAFLSSNFAGIYCFALLLASSQAVLRGYRPAHYYTLAWFFVLGATVLNTLHYQGIIHPPFIVQFNSLPGAVLEGLLMSLALADRVNFIRNKAERTIRELNGELSRHISKVEKIVDERTQTIRVILDHVKSGLLIVDRDGTIRGGSSRSCLELLNQEKIEGEPFAKVLGLEGREAAQFRMSLDQVFAELLPVDVSLDQLPRHVIKEPKTLQLGANPIRSADGSLQHVLFTIEDVTELRRRQTESRRNRRMIRILTEIAAFRQFIATSYETIQRLKQPLDAPAMKFMLHTLKGNSRVFRLNRLAHVVHELEGMNQVGPKEIQMLEGTIERFLVQNEKLLKISWGPQKEDLSLSHEKVQELIGTIQSLDNDRLRLRVQKWVEEISQPTIAALIKPMIENCHITAKRLGKFLHIHVQGDQLRTYDKKETVVIESLIHVLRNSVVHGIEKDRERIGKLKHGVIELTFAEEPSALKIRFRDDGQGFSRKDWEDVARRQFSLQESEVSAMSLQDLVFRVAQNGYSTQGHLSLDAGRGIGLGGMIQLIQQMEGRMELQSEEGQGCLFEIWLPRGLASAGVNLPAAV